MPKKGRFHKAILVALPTLIFILASQNVAYAEWWNTSWDKCRNITLTEGGLLDRTYEPIELNITGLTISNAINEIRIVNTYCNNDGNELPVQVLATNNIDWAKVIFLANTTLSGSTTYSIYYNNSGASIPDYSATQTGMNIRDIGGIPATIEVNITNAIPFGFQINGNAGYHGEKLFYVNGTRFDTTNSFDDAFSLFSTPHIVRNGTTYNIYDNDATDNYLNNSNTTYPIKQTVGKKMLNPDSSNVDLYFDWSCYNKNDWYKREVTYRTISAYQVRGNMWDLYTDTTLDRFHAKNGTGWFNISVNSAQDIIRNSDNMTMAIDEGLNKTSCIVRYNVDGTFSKQDSNEWDSWRITTLINHTINSSNPFTYTEWHYIYAYANDSEKFQKCEDLQKQIFNPLSTALGGELTQEETTTTTTSTTTTTTTSTTTIETTTQTTEFCIPQLDAWYHFNENNGTSIEDSSGNERDGITVNNPTWVTGKINNALSFDETQNQSAYFENVLNFERTQPFSIEFWINTTTNVTDIMGRLADGKVIALVKEDNVLIFIIANNIGENETGDGIVKATLHEIGDGIYHHIAITYDGSSDANGISFYIDGTEISGVVVMNNLTQSILNDGEFRIGGIDIADADYLNGTIDELAIYEFEMTGEQVSARYNSGSGTEEMFSICPPSTIIKYICDGEYLIKNTTYGDISYYNYTYCEYNCTETILGTRCNYSPSVNTATIFILFIGGLGFVVGGIRLIRGLGI
ncbi:MAG: hypothetical protein A2172_03780 [Candidatus Woykebacteria bacterium RBG_13_40_15]|uniref:LamG-like jellyroll fold domain-containing protein n=1 Tax=Candidatus Woykebacteria bacterium RBG_13_40_15 TaxID=1802593 RepID=A0A1G1W6K3_9BACT|nr:MAG: hypothetical protein A2172_03780 [Candidatus Woykebacteria bacterium RBG_13_40_15]